MKKKILLTALVSTSLLLGTCLTACSLDSTPSISETPTTSEIILKKMTVVLQGNNKVGDVITIKVYTDDNALISADNIIATKGSELVSIQANKVNLLNKGHVEFKITKQGYQDVITVLDIEEAPTKLRNMTVFLKGSNRVGDKVLVSAVDEDNNAINPDSISITRGSNLVSLNGNELTLLKEGEVQLTVVKAGYNSVKTSLSILSKELSNERMVVTLEGIKEVGNKLVLRALNFNNEVINVDTIVASKGANLVSIQGNLISLLKEGEVELTVSKKGYVDTKTIFTISEGTSIKKMTVLLQGGSTVGETINVKVFDNLGKELVPDLITASKGKENIGIAGQTLTLLKSGTAELLIKKSGYEDIVVTIYIEDKPVELQKMIITLDGKKQVGESLLIKIVNSLNIEINDIDISVTRGTNLVTLDGNRLHLNAAGIVELTVSKKGYETIKTTFTIESKPVLNKKMSVLLRGTNFVDDVMTLEAFDENNNTISLDSISAIKGSELVSISGNRITLQNEGDVTLKASKKGYDDVIVNITIVARPVSLGKMIVNLEGKKQVNEILTLKVVNSENEVITPDRVIASKGADLVKVNGNQIILLASGVVNLTITKSGFEQVVTTFVIEDAPVVLKNMTVLLQGDNKVGDTINAKVMNSENIGIEVDSITVVKGSTLVSITGTSISLLKEGSVTLLFKKNGYIDVEITFEIEPKPVVLEKMVVTLDGTKEVGNTLNCNVYNMNNEIIDVDFVTASKGSDLVNINGRKIELLKEGQVELTITKTGFEQVKISFVIDPAPIILGKMNITLNGEKKAKKSVIVNITNELQEEIQADAIIATKGSDLIAVSGNKILLLAPGEVSLKIIKEGYEDSIINFVIGEADREFDNFRDALLSSRPTFSHNNVNYYRPDYDITLTSISSLQVEYTDTIKAKYDYKYDKLNPIGSSEMISTISGTYYARGNTIGELVNGSINWNNEIDGSIGFLNLNFIDSIFTSTTIKGNNFEGHVNDSELITLFGKNVNIKDLFIKMSISKGKVISLQLKYTDSVTNASVISTSNYAYEHITVTIPEGK